MLSLSYRFDFPFLCAGGFSLISEIFPLVHDVGQLRCVCVAGCVNISLLEGKQCQEGFSLEDTAIAGLRTRK